MNDEMILEAKDVRDAWAEMVEHHLDSIFMSRQASINNDIMTPEEADEIIIEISNEKIKKYENMDDDAIHAKMLHDILGHIAGELEAQFND